MPLRTRDPRIFQLAPGTHSRLCKVHVSPTARFQRLLESIKRLHPGSGIHADGWIARSLHKTTSEHLPQLRRKTVEGWSIERRSQTTAMHRHESKSCGSDVLHPGGR